MSSNSLKSVKAVCTGIILGLVSGLAFAQTEVWRLDLASESLQASPQAFPEWMEKNGFQAFNYLFFKRRPEYWRIGPCEGDDGDCLVMREKDSSSHIIYPFEPALSVKDTMAVELGYLVKKQVTGASLDQKDKEDAPLRIFLSFQTEDELLHLALTDSMAHAAGTVVKSGREPDNIRYYMLPDRSEDDGYETGRISVRAVFQQVYGNMDPGLLVAIGIKSDSNNLGGESLTYLKTLRLVQ
jgi:hypothetical protein